MRNFIFDVWVWSKDKHSRPLKSIRIECKEFPSDRECWEYMAKDERSSSLHEKFYYGNIF